MNLHSLTLIAAPCLAMAAIIQLPATQGSPNAPGAWQALAPQDLSEASTWRELLQTEQLDAREKFFDAMVELASKSSADLQRLEALARDGAEREFSWTCRLALREVHSRNAQTAAAQADPFEALRLRMFTDPLGADPLGGFVWTDPSGRGPAGMLDPLSQVPGTSSGGAQFESFSLQIGSDGVTATVEKKDADGVMREQKYTAKTVEELLELYPELSAHIGNGIGGSLRGGSGIQQMRGFQLDRRMRPAMRTDVLGVFIVDADGKAGPDRAGLLIQGVMPGSLASELGLQPGQTLVEINGVELRSRDDISAALRTRDPAGALEVKVRGKQGDVQTKSWTPSSDPRGQARPLELHLPSDTRKI